MSTPGAYMKTPDEVISDAEDATRLPRGWAAWAALIVILSAAIFDRYFPWGVFG